MHGSQYQFLEIGRKKSRFVDLQDQETVEQIFEKVEYESKFFHFAIPHQGVEFQQLKIQMKIQPEYFEVLCTEPDLMETDH